MAKKKHSHGSSETAALEPDKSTTAEPESNTKAAKAETPEKPKVELVRVVVLRSFATGGSTLNPGGVIDVTEKEAQSWEKSGLAKRA